MPHETSESGKGTTPDRLVKSEGLRLVMLLSELRVNLESFWRRLVKAAGTAPCHCLLLISVLSFGCPCSLNYLRSHHSRFRGQLADNVCCV